MREVTGVAECDDLYGYSLQWWHIFAARVTFVLLFEVRNVTALRVVNIGCWAPMIRATL